MAKPTITETLELPGGIVPTAVSARLRLVASTTTEAVGYAPGSTRAVGGSQTVWCDATGAYSFANVRPNQGSGSDAITSPANTVYELVVSIPGRPKSTRYLSVPDAAGPYRVDQVEANSPTGLPNGYNVLKSGDTMSGDLNHGAAKSTYLSLGTPVTGSPQTRDDSPEAIRLGWTNAIRSLGRDGTTSYHLMSIINYPAIDGGGGPINVGGNTYNPSLDLLIGDARIAQISMSSNVDMAGNDIIDVKHVGNQLGLYSTRLIQGLAAVDGGAGYDVGIATMGTSGYSGLNMPTDRLIVNNAVDDDHTNVKIVNAHLQVATGQLAIGTAPTDTTGYAANFSVGTDLSIQVQNKGVAYRAINLNPAGGNVSIGPGGLTFAEAGNLAVGTTTGTKLGTATTQKLGFWNATPVVRPTGWGAPTGTPTRTTFATSSVTLSVLAEHVKALIDDLTTIGVIGA